MSDCRAELSLWDGMDGMNFEQVEDDCEKRL